MPWPGRWTWTSPPNLWVPARTASPSTCPTSGPPPRRSRRSWTTRSPRTCTRASPPLCSPVTTAGELPTPTGNIFEWEDDATYVRKPPYFEGMGREPEPVTDISGARALAKLGDSVTTDHIPPAG